MMNWVQAKHAIEKGLSPQISDYNAVSDIQWAMYQTVSQLVRIQWYGAILDNSPAPRNDENMPVVWERKS